MASGNAESVAMQICTERRKENREPTKEAQSINRGIVGFGVHRRGPKNHSRTLAWAKSPSPAKAVKWN
jgi:hypothetical protein